MNTTRTSGRHVNDCARESATPRSCATFRSLWKPLGVFIFGVLFYSQELVQAQLEQAPYTLEEIVIPGATEASANANSTHEVAGDFTDNDGVTHGFVLSKGVFTTVDFPGAAFTQINGINASGRFAGTYYINSDPENARGFFSSKGDFVTIHPPQSSRTQVGFLNAQGEVVGTFRDANSSPLPFKRRGFIWKDGHVTTTFNVDGDADAPGGTVAFGINDKGETVGNYLDPVAGRFKGFFRSSKGKFTTFEVPGASRTIGEGINNEGTIVGLYVEADGSVHGFVLRNGIFTTVNVPDAVQTQVLSINSKGEIVGLYVDAAGFDHGFVGTPIR
jgi:hypothetical protein